jgi:hypothetical protein
VEWWFAGHLPAIMSVCQQKRHSHIIHQRTGTAMGLNRGPALRSRSYGPHVEKGVVFSLSWHPFQPLANTTLQTPSKVCCMWLVARTDWTVTRFQRFQRCFSVDAECDTNRTTWFRKRSRVAEIKLVFNMFRRMGAIGICFQGKGGGQQFYVVLRLNHLRQIVRITSGCSVWNT